MTNSKVKYNQNYSFLGTIRDHFPQSAFLCLRVINEAFGLDSRGLSTSQAPLSPLPNGKGQRFPIKPCAPTSTVPPPRMTSITLQRGA